MPEPLIQLLSNVLQSAKKILVLLLGQIMLTLLAMYYGYNFSVYGSIGAESLAQLLSGFQYLAILVILLSIIGFIVTGVVFLSIVQDYLAIKRLERDNV